jgi:hypothetical protein
MLRTSLALQNLRTPVTGDTNGLSQKELKKLSKCESGSAADDDLTLGEVKDCYRQVFDQGQGQDKEDQSSSPLNNMVSKPNCSQAILIKISSPFFVTIIKYCIYFFAYDLVYSHFSERDKITNQF